MPASFLSSARIPPSQAALLACLAIALAAGCGNGGGSTSGIDNERLVVTGIQERTVFSTGTFEFDIIPELTTDERIVCSVNDRRAESCFAENSKGRLEYRDLPHGRHRLSIELHSSHKLKPTTIVHHLEIVDPGVVIFAANPAGITAAIAAARAGQKVALIEPTNWVGGMMSAGLTKTDTGARGYQVFGGLTAEYFVRVRDAEIAKGSCFGTCGDTHFDFEPHVAERVFEAMLEEAGVVVERAVQLVSVEKEDARIVRLQTSRGEITGDVFIDASYEGDLMALSGIPYSLGREASLQPDPPDDAQQLAEFEEHAGTRAYRLPRGLFVDPYIVPGDPESGTLPWIEARPDNIPPPGSADSRVMAFTNRLCVTDDPSNRIPFSQPVPYDISNYEAHARLALAIAERRDLSDLMFNPSPTALSRNRAYYKYDLNGGSTFSSDMSAPHLNQAYVEASEAERERIRIAYRNYIEGLYWTWQSDPRFGTLNDEMSRFGYCADEFTDRGGWPHKLYVRIARRMTGEYIMNENDVMQNGRRPPITDSVGFGSYDIDMHTYRYFAAPVSRPDGSHRDALVFEGFLIVHTPEDAPYPISWRALLPHPADATNLINPVTLSATAVAYSSIRMEPTFMILGESAGIAAALVAESGENVQALSYDRLRARLIAAGQILSLPD